MLGRGAIAEPQGSGTLVVPFGRPDPGGGLYLS